MNEDPKGHRNFYNLPSDRPLSATMPKEVVKADFARRLNQAMLAKGWNQSELHRRSRVHTPKDAAGITRDLVSKYIGAKSLPSPVNLQILVDTLGVKREELLPAGVANEAGDIAPAASAVDQGGGVVWLRINQAVSWPKALKILSLLRGEEDA